MIVSTNDYPRITKLTSRKQKTLHAQKSNNNKQTNICYKKHQYVFNNICKVSTQKNFSQHDVLSRLIGDIFEIIYLQIYHISWTHLLYTIYIHISNQLTAIFTFATKSQQIFEMTEQYVFVGQKLFRLSFRLCVFNKRMCNNMITNFRCFWRTVFAQQII